MSPMNSKTTVIGTRASDAEIERLDNLAGKYGVSRAQMMTATMRAGMDFLEKVADSPFTPLLLKAESLLTKDQEVKGEIKRFEKIFNEQKAKHQGKLKFS